jgi:hypothetical protein
MSSGTTLETLIIYAVVITCSYSLAVDTRFPPRR